MARRQGQQERQGGKGGSFVIFSGVAAAKIAVGTMAVAITTAVCALYLVRLAAPGRRDASGVTAFLLFGALALALLALQLIR